MEFVEIYEKTVYAFEHDEVYELLTGKKGYAYQAPRYIASVPTCDEFIFRDGIYPYYKTLDEREKQDALQKLSAAFTKMINSGDATLLWWALSLLQGQKDQEAYFKRSPFVLADYFWDKLAIALNNNKDSLAQDHSYMGGGHSDGLWGEVRHIDLLLREDYGISVVSGD